MNLEVICRIRRNDSDPDPTLSFYIKLSSKVKESHEDWCRKAFFKKLFKCIYISFIKGLP